jgi:hypothetical protein
MPELGKIANGVWETSKLGGSGHILLFPIGVFTRFNCALVTTQEISIIQVPQIGEFSSGVRETSKLGGSGHILLFPIEVFTLFNCALVATQNISIVKVS